VRILNYDVDNLIMGHSIEYEIFCNELNDLAFQAATVDGLIHFKRVTKTIGYPMPVSQGQYVSTS